MRRKYQRHALDFTIEFFPVSQDKFMFNVYRFQIYEYEPCSLIPNNVQYFFISDTDFGKGEFAIMGVCDYLEKGEMKQDCQLMIKNGDREVFHFVKLLVLEKLAQKNEKGRMVEVKDKV